jgi:hypothetical protein
VEKALLVTKLAREANPKAHIIVRCYVDDFAEILETLAANAGILQFEKRFRRNCLATRYHREIMSVCPGLTVY